MNWADFNTRHENIDQAFEAFGRHLFSNWCNFTYGDSINGIIYVGGKGGDGGVEAFARCTDGSVIGFQAKCFRETFKSTQVKQLENSISSAKKRHPALTKYIVCMPIELQGSQGRGNNGQSQYERWETFCDTEKDMEFDFWGDTRIEEIAITIGFQNYLAYWFNSNFINISEWQSIYDRKKAAYFNSLYISDLHMQGKYDKTLNEHLLTSDVRQENIKRIEVLKQKINTVHRELQRLPSLYNWEKIPVQDKGIFKNLTLTAEKGLSLLIEFQEKLSSDSPFDAPLLIDWMNSFFPVVHRAIKIIEGEKANFSLSPMNHCKKYLEAIFNLEDKLFNWIHYGFSELDKPLALIGDAGSGKTHSVLDVCKNRLKKGFPALVIPAKAINPRNTASSQWLSDYIDKPQWSLTDCFQAMESSAFSSYEGIDDVLLQIPSRFLLVIDGLEESSHNTAWQNNLAEFGVLLKNYPKIKLVCTTRPTHTDLLIPRQPEFCHVNLEHEDNVPLHILFREYCRKYKIDIAGQRWVQWALRSPREIRLFAEIYRGQKLSKDKDLSTSVSGLMKKNISQLEEKLSKNEQYGWNLSKPIFFKGLIAYSKKLINDHAPFVEHDELLKTFKTSCAEFGEMNIPQLTFIIEGFVSGGILDKRFQPPEDRLEEEPIYYYPANQSVIDFLLAYSAMQLIQKDDKGQFNLLDILSSIRFEPLALFLQMLNEKEEAYVSTEKIILPERINVAQIENAQLLALSRSLKEPPSKVKQWVEKLFLYNKTSNRRILDYLILPTVRNNCHWCGAEYLHNIFLPVPVAERDILWSCPDYLPDNCGGKWEGYCKLSLDDIELYPEDLANGMPLLLAWCCSSVVADRVRRARTKLAKWGCANPKEFATLLVLFENCNDYQVLENILTAGVGAACITDDREGLKELASQCFKMFFSDSLICSTRNSVCLHAARVIIERAFAYELVSEDQVQAARPLYKASALLPYRELSDGYRKNPISGDLEWYVVKNASRGFFEQLSENVASNEEKKYPKKEIVQAVIEGHIKLNEAVEENIKGLWVEMEDERKKREALWKSISIKYQLANKGESEEEIEEIKKDQRILQKAFEEKESKYSLAATNLLDAYKKKYNLGTLTPDKLRDGLIIAFVYSLGWNPEIFYGSPNGGKKGECLGADVSITREHWPATHGSRSPIASFGEKYVWLGVNEVAGFFADHMPIKDIGDREFKSVTSYSDVGKEMADPFDGDMSESEESSEDVIELSFPEHFLPEYKANGKNQLEISTDWVNNAPWPDIKILITTNDSFRICSWIYGVESHSTVSQSLRITCSLISESQFEIFKRDVASGTIKFQGHGGDISCAGIDGACYQSPSVTCWAPWIKTIEDSSESYNSIDENGNLFPIDLRYLPAKTYWSCNGDETMLYFPSPVYAQSLGIVRGDGSKNHRKFTDKDENTVAIFERLDLGISGIVEHLLIDQSRLDTLLHKEHAVAIWFAEVYREVPPEIIPEEERKDLWAQRRLSFICAKEYGKELQDLSSIEIGS